MTNAMSSLILDEQAMPGEAGGSLQAGAEQLAKQALTNVGSWISSLLAETDTKGQVADVQEHFNALLQVLSRRCVCVRERGHAFV
jgi:hypothetical protein